MKFGTTIEFSEDVKTLTVMPYGDDPADNEDDFGTYIHTYELKDGKYELIESQLLGRTNRFKACPFK